MLGMSTLTESLSLAGAEWYLSYKLWNYIRELSRQMFWLISTILGSKCQRYTVSQKPVQIEGQKIRVCPFSWRTQSNSRKCSVLVFTLSIQISNVTSRQALDHQIKWTLLACKPKNLNTLSLYLSFCSDAVRPSKTVLNGNHTCKNVICWNREQKLVPQEINKWISSMTSAYILFLYLVVCNSCWNPMVGSISGDIKSTTFGTTLYIDIGPVRPVSCKVGTPLRGLLSLDNPWCIIAVCSKVGGPFHVCFWFL